MAGKRGAPMGNKNAAGARGGARSAAVGSLVPFGTLVTGFAGGAGGKDDRFASRHRKTATAIGGTVGAVAGTFAVPVVGTAIGGVIGAAAGNVSSRVGYALGHSIHKPTTPTRTAHTHLKNIPKKKK